MQNKIISIIIMWLLIALGVSAQGKGASRYNMTYLNMVSGMPSNFVDDIYQDSNGFMWLSTHGGGLVRYDGFSFLDFGLSSSGIQLRSNSCRNVFEDRHKRLWVAFEEGIQVLDLNTLRPVVPACETDALASMLRKLFKERCTRVYCDGKGAVWLVQPARICRLGFGEEGKISSILSMKYESYAPDLGILDVYGRGTVVVGNGGMVSEISVKGNHLAEKDLTAQFPKLNGQYVGAIIRYDGKIWIGTNAGLFNNGRADNIYHCSAADHSLQHDLVTSLALSPDGRLMVGTLCGVDVIDGKTGEIEHWNSGSMPNPLSSNFVNSIFCKNGQIWIGTETGGITKFSPRRLDIVNYQHVSGDASSIARNAVNAMYVEPDGTLWVGMVEGGLDCLSPHGSQFVHFTTRNSQLSHNSVSVLAPDGKGNLWIGTWGGGVCVMSLRTPGQISRLAVDATHGALLTFIGAMAYDSVNGGMWIGANEGLYFYNMKTRRLEEPFPGCRDIRGNVGSVITRNHHLLMGCLQGMVDVDLKSRPSGKGHFRMRHYPYKLDNPESEVFDKILCFCQAHDGKVWAGSNGYGMYCCTFKANGTFDVKTYTVADGLANNTVKGIVEDAHGTLWVATDNGLSLFNPKTGAFNNFYQNDGLLSSQFYFNGAAKGRQGVIYLGTNRGLIAVGGGRPAAVYKGNLKFTSLTVDNQQIFADGHYLDEDISIATKLRLHESDKSFTIHFSALDYGSETQGVYSYRMKGLEDDWVRLQPGQHSVRYSTLPAGKYEFVVKYSPSIGSDKEQTISMGISVTPYFYKSWWFVSMLVICFVALAQYAYMIHLRRVREREAEALYRPIEVALKESDNPGMLQSRIQGILRNQRLYQEGLTKIVETDKKEAEEKRTPFMDRLMEIMEQNYIDSEFGAQELADAIGMSRGALSKRVNAEMGIPTSQFIRNYRLDIARRMIMENVADRNITEIAWRVGFNDPKYFTRCFTKVYGVSPTNYKDEV